MSTRITSQLLKQKLLADAWPLVDDYINAALGKSELKSTNVDARTEVWDVLKQLMLASSDKIDIDIKSAEDVIAAVTQGKCTFEEGEKLIKLYESAKKIETSAMVQGGAGGISITILGAQPTEIETASMPKVIEHED